MKLSRGGAILEGRCEYKYLLPDGLAETLKPLAAAQIPPDGYGGGKPYTVSSVYFDDAVRTLERQTLDREPWRVKLRLRVYGETNGPDSVSFFEIKSKHLGRSIKTRLSGPLSQNERLWREGVIPDGLSARDRKVAHDILTLIEQYRLSPAAVVSYERLAFAAPGEERLRVTFDSKLRIRTDALDLTEGTHGEPVMPPGFAVLECKSANNLPLWLVRLLSDYKLRNTTYSKYGHTPLAPASVAPPAAMTTEKEIHS